MWVMSLEGRREPSKIQLWVFRRIMASRLAPDLIGVFHFIGSTSNLVSLTYFLSNFII